MIIAGLKLTILGMGVVTCFLLILVLIVSISSRLLGEESTKEQIKLDKDERRRRKRGASGKEDGTLVAVISAAVAAYRRKRM